MSKILASARIFKLYDRDAEIREIYQEQIEYVPARKRKTTQQYDGGDTQQRIDVALRSRVN